MNALHWAASFRLGVICDSVSIPGGDGSGSGVWSADRQQLLTALSRSGCAVHQARVSSQMDVRLDDDQGSTR